MFVLSSDEASLHSVTDARRRMVVTHGQVVGGRPR